MSYRVAAPRIVKPQRIRPLLLLLSCGGVLSSTAPANVSPGWVPAAATASTCAAAPSAPGGVMASGTVGLGTFLNWTPAAAPAGCSVTYTVFENGTSIGTTANTSFAVTGLAHSTSYTFTVEATDSAGTSIQSSAVNVTTLPVTGKDYYVATNGSDSSGNGSSGKPWATIGHAVSAAKAGDTVYVGSGTYHESVSISSSGTASAPIIIDGQGAAIVDGSTGVACCTSPAFVSDNGFVGSNTQGLFTIGSANDVNNVTVEGFTIQNYKTTSTDNAPAGILIVGGGSAINVLDNTVQNIQSTAKQGKSAGPNAYGIAVFGTSATPLSVNVSYNTVTGCLTGQSETTTFNGNVQNFLVSYNIIHDNDNIGMDAIGFEGVGPTGSDQAKNGVFYGNVIYNNSSANNPGYKSGDYGDDGLYCDGCAQVVFERNTVYANDIGIEVASEISGKVSSNVIVRNNLVYASNAVGISVGGYDSSGTGGSQNVTIVNNTLYDNDLQNTGGGEFQIQYRATGITFENNVVYASSKGVFLHGYASGSGVTLDNNDYYTSGSTAQFQLNGKSYSSFASYRSATPAQDAHSLVSNPNLVSLPACSATATTPPGGHGSNKGAGCTTLGNLDLQSGSPAWNAGNAGLGSPSGSGYSSYEQSQPFVGAVDFSSHPRVNGNGQINIGAYEE